MKEEDFLLLIEDNSKMLNEIEKYVKSLLISTCDKNKILVFLIKHHYNNHKLLIDFQNSNWESKQDFLNGDKGELLKVINQLLKNELENISNG